MSNEEFLDEDVLRRGVRREGSNSTQIGGELGPVKRPKNCVYFVTGESFSCFLGPSIIPDLFRGAIEMRIAVGV